MDLSPPVRLSLAHVPTPLEPLARLDDLVEAEVWVKRDDLTGVALSGNKVRKLEFLVADALERGCDTLVTCGAVTSNHARATAVAAARMGLRSHLVLRGEETDPPDGNLLLDRLVGADLTFIEEDDWQHREDLMEDLASGLALQGRQAYVIPEGGSNALGALGYALAARELLEQERAMGIRIGTVVHAAGSGGTTAGLALGFAAAGRDDVDVVGMAVCNDSAYFDRVVRRIVGAAAATGYVPADVAEQARWRIVDAYKGVGYARTTADELSLIRRVARREGLILDPVYTGKAFRGLVEEHSAGRLGNEGAVVFVHTGGIFGLFSFAEALRAHETRAP